MLCPEHEALQDQIYVSSSGFLLFRKSDHYHLATVNLVNAPCSEIPFITFIYLLLSVRYM